LKRGKSLFKREKGGDREGRMLSLDGPGGLRGGNG